MWMGRGVLGICGPALALGMLLVIVGCVEERRVVRETFPGMREAADRQRSEARARSDRGSVRSAERSGWTILVAEFTGRDARRQAERLAGRIRSQTSVTGLWVHHDGDRARLYRGRYPDPRVDAAVEDLRELRVAELEDGQRFRESRLVMVMPGRRGPTSEYDLRQHAGMYSLQIGFYDEAAGDFEKAAEQMVEVLRADGVEAYFYHGPVMSSVTVGLFTDADLVAREHAGGGKIMVYGPAVRQLQEQFPHNLGNGRTIVVNLPGGRQEVRPSFLVQVRN
ncbi:MAG: hypothetical protein JJU36_12805 [Phycisphaeraceae bacterium]|nr:hypothetical protein [Phycisphaeraceae bacterium]